MSSRYFIIRGLKDLGLGIRVWCLGLMAKVSEFRIQGLVEGSWGKACGQGTQKEKKLGMYVELRMKWEPSPFFRLSMS